jgi:2-oxo-4-hydroxy-4-carboxy-5-ureidoimidazoline decarboxylase
MSQPDMRAESAEVRPSTGSRPVPLEEFNRLSPEAADRLLRPCLDIDRGVRELIDRRPYARADELIETARQAASPFKIALLRLAWVVAP